MPFGQLNPPHRAFSATVFFRGCVPLVASSALAQETFVSICTLPSLPASPALQKEWIATDGGSLLQNRCLPGPLICRRLPLDGADTFLVSVG